ncbi:hypothetical protein [Isoptericola sp. AK164]|uniref:hypothetical protein n=1 Tax=Isoptericola sp. AK164 TaxID=3024246 RepID=UPI002418B726|nr:hypothetical protein [Isoptericola sp. AK164]
MIDRPEVDDEQYFRDIMDRYSVPTATQDELFEKLDRGVAWDANDPTAAPVSVETNDALGKSETVKRYEDGSIAVLSVQQPAATDGIMPRRWLGCGYTVHRSTYNTVDDCFVDWTRGTTKMKFAVDAEIWHSGRDKILRAHTGSYRYAQGCASASLSVNRKTESTSGAPARASMVMDGDILCAGGGRSYTLVIEVGNDRFSHTADF